MVSSLFARDFDFDESGRALVNANTGNIIMTAPYSQSLTGVAAITLTNPLNYIAIDDVSYIYQVTCTNADFDSGDNIKLIFDFNKRVKFANVDFYGLLTNNVGTSNVTVALYSSNEGTSWTLRGSSAHGNPVVDEVSKIEASNFKARYLAIWITGTAGANGQPTLKIGWLGAYLL